MNIENKLTPQESLEIITKSIEQSRRNLEKAAGTPMILWGTLVFVFSIAIAYLWSWTGNPQWNLLWFAMSAIGYAIAYFLQKKSAPRVESFISSVISKVWIGFGILAVATPTLTILCLKLIEMAFPAGYLIFPDYVQITLVEVVLLGLATSITGFILKNGWIAAAGIICGIVGAAFAIVLRGPAESLLLSGISLIGLIIPGIIIDLKANRNE